MLGTQQALNKCWLDEDTSVDFQTPVAAVALFFSSLTGKQHRSPDNFVNAFSSFLLNYLWGIKALRFIETGYLCLHDNKWLFKPNQCSNTES